MIDLAFFVLLFAAAIRISTSFLLAAIGETLAERSGVLNLGIEGIMAMGASTGFLAAFFSGNLWAGVLVALVVGASLGFLMAFMSVNLGTNQVVNGLAITIMGLGMSYFIYRLIFGILPTPPTVLPFRDYHVPLLSKIPILGPIFFQQLLLTYIALILVPLSWFILFKTPWGLKVRAVGENPRAADTAGINVYRIRYLCVMMGAALAGFGGAFLSIAQFNMFLPGTAHSSMVAGRGFIAIALVIFGGWNPLKVFLGGLLFGSVEALGLRLQAAGFPIPYQFLLMLPYVVTVIALLSVSRRVGAPAALCESYKRGE